jgi:hypothetical protein
MNDTNKACWRAVRRIVLFAFLMTGSLLRVGAQVSQHQRLAVGSMETYMKQRDGFVCLMHLLVLDESGTLYITDNGCAALAPVPFSVSKEDARFLKAMANARQQIDSWRELEQHDPGRARSNYSETIVDVFRSEDRASFCKKHPDWFVLDLHLDPVDDVLKPCENTK